MQHAHAENIATAPGKVILVPFARSHLRGAHNLSQEMSWSHRLEDWEMMLDLGQGFVLRDAGEVVGTALWWTYGEAHACTGMILVAKAAQGRGYGARLMDAVLAAAHPRAITLNSTAAGLALYKRRGFTPVGIVQQYQGVPMERHEAPPCSLVRTMVQSDAETVARLDREATGWERDSMLRRLGQLAEGHVLLRERTARGYAFCRAFGRGHVIGPVVAESLEDARAVIEASLASLGRSFVRIDTSAASGLGEWLQSIGLQRVGVVTTMVVGPKTHPMGLARVFALANQSLN